MSILYIFILALIVFGLVISFLKPKNESTSPYSKIKEILDDRLFEANFSGDWKRRQVINLQLIWLKTLNVIESRDFYGNNKNRSKTLSHKDLSLDDVKIPLSWKLDDFYCYQFALEIISDYGRVLADSEYKGNFKPNSILPVPKVYIRKAILYMNDYCDQTNPIYEVKDKNKLRYDLDIGQEFLEMFFVETENVDLPKSGVENFKVGTELKEKEREYNELDNLTLVDWLSESDWMIRGIHYSDKGLYDYAFACFDKAKNINPSSVDLKTVISIVYFGKGEHHYNNGEIELAFESIKKAAELKNEEAVKWLEKHSKN